MEKCCDYCGAVFITKYKHQRFCCSKHKDKSRYGVLSRQRRIVIDTDAEKALELYKSDYTVNEICSILGRCSTFVYNTWRSAGLPRRETKTQKAVRGLRERGLCCYEIAQELGKPTKNIQQIAIAIGMPFTEDETKLSIDLAKSKGIKTRYGDEEQRAEKQRFFIARNFPEWEYISGYISSDGFVKLKHKECGTVTDKSAISVRHHKNIKCPVCAEQAKAYTKEIKRLEREAKKREKEAAKVYSQKALSFKTCIECNAPFVGTRANASFCSDECKRRYANRKHDKRIQRAAVIDDSITLKKLMSRDNCTCWICGGKCNPEDHSIDRNGAFIVGPDYPSIDHVYPLSRGGAHTWENVKLAHHYCNTLKSDKVVGYV